MSTADDILALEHRFWQTMIDKDAAAGAALCAEPCIVTGGQGVGRIDRKTFTKMMEGGTWTLRAYSFSDVKVEKFSDDVAVIAYKVREELTVDGKPLTMDAADASTWVRRDGQWLCALHTESVLGDPYGRDRVPQAKTAAG
jgi:uncharacterized protein (TIGR02246 family)